jgi:acyl-CoA synthetase (AMP-forming)/AMP-acid ligase II
MSGAPSRLRNVLGHLLPLGGGVGGHTHHHHPPNNHGLSPTFFLERAAAIEPDAEAVFHITANGKVLRRSYIEVADRARGLAYFLLKKGYKRVGILAPNTPAFLESIYGIVAAGGVIVPVNYRLKPDDIAYIFDYAEVDVIIADVEYQDLLGLYLQTHPKTPVIVDVVSFSMIGGNNKGLC